MAGLLLDLVPQATNEVLTTPVQQRLRSGRGLVPVRSLRDAVQQLVGCKQSLVAKAWILLGFAFQCVSKETDSEVTVGFAEPSGGQPLGLSVVQINHERIITRRPANNRPALPSGGIRNHDEERSSSVSMPPLLHLAHRGHIRLRISGAIGYFETIPAGTSPAVGRVNILRLCPRITPAALGRIDVL